MILGDAGKGCGCLIFVMLGVLVVAGLIVHPMSLRFFSARLVHEDRIVPSDVVFVPRVPEDKDGELYIEAFREYWAGNAKKIYVEEDKVFGLSMKEIVARMAGERGIKQEAVEALQLEGDRFKRARQVKEAFGRAGVKRAIIIAPDYASRSFHLLYGEPPAGKTVFLVKPVKMTYFRLDGWWREGASRGVFARELYDLGATLAARWNHGETQTGNHK